MFLFFFQAEDGIRDLYVTGVQTCALPISVRDRPLYLLDADVPENGPAERAVTNRLYGGDREHRLRQEILLGIGGLKALAAVGADPEVFYSNEGHAGFLGIERIRLMVEERGLDPAVALQDRK